MRWLCVLAVRPGGVLVIAGMDFRYVAAGLTFEGMGTWFVAGGESTKHFRTTCELRLEITHSKLIDSSRRLLPLHPCGEVNF